MMKTKKIDSEINLEWQEKWKYYKKIEILEAVILDKERKSEWEIEVYIKDFSSYFNVKILETNWLKRNIVEFIENFLYKKLKRLDQYWKIEEEINTLNDRVYKLDYNDRVYKLDYNDEVQKIFVNLCSVLESNFNNILNCYIYGFKLILFFDIPKINNTNKLTLFWDIPKINYTNKLINIIKGLDGKLLNNKFKGITQKYNWLVPFKYKFIKKKQKRKNKKNEIELNFQTNLNYIKLFDIKRVFNIKGFFQNHESLFSQYNDFEELDKQALYLNVKESDDKNLENLETKIFKLQDRYKFFVEVILDSEINLEWQEKTIEINWEKKYEYVFFTERWEYLKWSLKTNKNNDG